MKQNIATTKASAGSRNRPAMFMKMKEQTEATVTITNMR